MLDKPKALPKEFRRDLVALARKVGSAIVQIAKDFGISPAALLRWLKITDVQDGVVPGVTKEESPELCEEKKRIRLLVWGAKVKRKGHCDPCRTSPQRGRC